MSETVLTSPIILDATGQDMLTKLDSIISAINPVAQGVSYDNAGTGMVANNVQSAITELKTGLVNTNASLTNKDLWTWSDNTRFQMLGGGYKNMGSYVIINLVVKAKTSATNSPSISSVASAYKPTVDTALSCIDITSGISSAITDSVPCGISSAAGTIYIKSITLDHIYAITGYYLIV